MTTTAIMVGFKSSTRISQRINALRALLDPERLPSGMCRTACGATCTSSTPARAERSATSLSDDAPTGTGKTTPHTGTYHGCCLRLLQNARVVEVDELETADPLRGEMKATITPTDRGRGTDLVAVHDGLPHGLSPVDNEAGWRRKALTRRRPAR
jgi:hypothetical protein